MEKGEEEGERGRGGITQSQGKKQEKEECGNVMTGGAAQRAGWSGSGGWGWSRQKEK